MIFYDKSMKAYEIDINNKHIINKDKIDKKYSVLISFAEVSYLEPLEPNIVLTNSYVDFDVRKFRHDTKMCFLFAMYPYEYLNKSRAKYSPLGEVLIFNDIYYGLINNKFYLIRFKNEVLLCNYVEEHNAFQIHENNFIYLNNITKEDNYRVLGELTYSCIP